MTFILPKDTGVKIKADKGIGSASFESNWIIEKRYLKIHYTPFNN